MYVVLVSLTALLSYLIGAIPFGYLIARTQGVDILKEGSGNIGATNVGRVMGRRFGILVFLLDFAKGALPVLLAGLILSPSTPELPPDSLAVLAGVAAFLGHLFPIYLRFRGGKGVATGLGVVAVLVPLSALLAFLAWGAVLSLTRYMSLASLTGATTLCVARLLLCPAPFEHDHLIVTLFCFVGTLLIFARHYGNIRRLISGTEHRF